MERRPEFTRIRAVIGRSIHFRDIDPHDLDRIASLGRLRRLKDGQAAPPDGGHGRHLFVIVSGCVRLSSATRQGREFVYALLGPGSFYGLGNVIKGIDPRADAEASGATEIAVIDGPGFLALLDREPRLWRHVAVLLHKRLTHAMWAIRDNSVAPLAERLVRRLLALAAAAAPAHGAPVSLRLTQTDLGRMLGTSRSRINGILKRLERERLVEVSYRTIKLSDL
ncbi:MAG: Crp/Fnr family transcriptional regulator, partial [Betaproteobacteria bacterium]|nr:Crp/Fnr family transcriptional regulator [Betaproteobacteria bacterium]